MRGNLNKNIVVRPVWDRKDGSDVKTIGSVKSDYQRFEGTKVRGSGRGRLQQGGTHRGGSPACQRDARSRRPRHRVHRPEPQHEQVQGRGGSGDLRLPEGIQGAEADQRPDQGHRRDLRS